jgi:hypothetical protein
LTDEEQRASDGHLNQSLATPVFRESSTFGRAMSAAKSARFLTRKIKKKEEPRDKPAPT